MIAQQESRCRKPITRRSPIPKAETLSRQDFNANQWDTFKTLVMTANRLLLEGTPQDIVLDVLGHLSEDRQDLSIRNADRIIPVRLICYA